jgi:membrane peptidoglycan carboxypeptidase
MQTSLARRQRRRRNGSDHRSSGNSNVARIAIALPIFLFASLLVAGVVGFAGAVMAFTYYSQGLPDPKDVFNNLSFSQETRILDRSGKVQLATFALQQRDVVTYDQIPPVLIDATTATEDKTFWENAGFDPSGILAAGLDTLTGSARGASTITQQLVRARLLPQSALTGPSYERKIREIIQSVRLTQEFPGVTGKQEIITAYLNQNFYGNSSYGVAAAARSYWGITDLHKLTLAQAAILAGIPQSPTDFDLVKNAVEQTGADGKQHLVVPPNSPIVQRRNYILELMKTRSVLTAGTYTTADYDAAEQEPVVLSPPNTSQWLAPQFVLQVRHQLGVILCSAAQADNCPAIDTGGYTVITTLDYGMQRLAEKWTQAGARGPNAKNPAAYVKALGVPYQTWMQNLVGKDVNNAALAAIDYRTGQVYAYTGSAGFYLPGNKQFQPQFDVLADGWRQPGSAFKPINYIIGLDDHTLTAASMFMDVTTDFGGGYTPTDADLLERGPVRLRQAIQVSLNIPAIKAAIEIGPDRVFQRSQDFGLEYQSTTNTAGASIAIGTLEVHMIDLISAYGAIANGGVLMPRTTILEVLDSNGQKIWPPAGPAPQGKLVVSSQAAFIMTDIIAGNTDPAQNPFWSKRAIYDGGTRRPATLKTGTTNDTKDLTAMGYLAPPTDPKAPAFVVGAWMGNSDNSAPPGGVVSLETAASLWQSFLTAATKGLPIATFQQPPGVVQATVDAFTGMLPGPFSDETVKEWFIDGTVPTQVDTTKVPLQIDSATGKLWQAGCAGPEETQGFLDLSGVEADYPQWKTFNDGWIARAMKGPGVAGGPEKTRTSYFYENGVWNPYGSTWGAPFPPTDTCEVVTPSPEPSPSFNPFASPGPSPSEPFPPSPFPPSPFPPSAFP